MSEASWAAAGMLAAGDPDNPSPLNELATLSLRLYPDYLGLIARLSGKHVRLLTSLTLQGMNVGKSFHLHHQAGRSISPAEAEDLVPHLATSGRDFRLLEESSLDPRDLCVALPMAARAAGVTLVENTSVLGVSTLADQRIAVRTSRGAISATAFVNCAGAWAADIEHSHTILKCSETTDTVDSSPFPIKPLKGQMLTVRLEARDSPRCVIRTPEVYLVPRGDGRVIIGATVEDVGFDKTVGPQATRTLMARAAAVWPPISSATILESWAGLRPGSPDGLPIIGPVCEPDLAPHCASRQWIAAGHFRNGILLAPATAHIVSQLVCGLPSEIDITPFSCRRFAFAPCAK